MEKPRRPRRNAPPNEIEAYEAQLRAWQTVQRNSGNWNKRYERYKRATNRPTGTLDAGSATVNNQPGYYATGEWAGGANHTDLYYGPHGPFGPDHDHYTTNDGGDTWEDAHEER